MSSDSDDEIVAVGSGIGTRRQLRRRGAASGAAAGSGRRLHDEDTEEDSGSDIEQARRKKGKKIPLPEEDEAGPSGMQQPIASDGDSSAWESDWNSDEEKLLKQGGQEAAAALVSKLGYASDSSNSSSDGDKCPICLLSLNDQEVGVPEVCDHMFCAPCIEEWAKNVTTCPIDRKNFDAINVYKTVDRKHLVRKNQVQTKPADDVPVLEDHELTYCEVCRRPDREDTMLLCDQCNLGFHMECLSPPLEVIPTGSWYCDCCFGSASEEDDEEVNDLLNDLDNEMDGLRQTRLRQRMFSPPRIVRTRQSERIRSTILTRTSTSVRLNVVEDDQQPGPSTRRTARTATTAAPSKSVRKRRKRRTRRKILHMIISEYDVNNDDEKFAVRRKKIYKTLKRLSKKRSKRKRASRSSRSTRQSAGVAAGMEGAVADLQHQRFSTGIPTLKIFGGANDLDYFSDDGDGLEADVSIGGRGETAVQSVRSAIRNPLGRRRALKSGFEPSSSSGSVDLLGSIMQDQTRWHSKQGTKDIKIDNGKIIFQSKVSPTKTTQIPGVTQAGLDQNSSGNAGLPGTSSTGSADSTSATGGSSGSTEPSSSSSGAASSSGAGGSGGNGRGNDLFDPLDTSIFVDLPPLKGKENEKDKQKKNETLDPMDTSIFVDLPPLGATDKDKKKKKNDGFDMFGMDSPIPLPQQPSTSQVPLNPAPEISTTTSDGADPGPSRGFGKFKFTMTSEPDNNDNCPNMSMYSSETLEYTKSAADGAEPYDPLDSEQKTDDEGGERDEDLVQLDDEDPVESPAKLQDQQEGIPNGTEKLPTGDPDHDAFDSDSEDELKQIEEVSASGGPEPEPEPSTELEALTPPLTTTVAAALVTSSTAVTTVAAANTTSVASSVDEGPVASSAQGGEEDRSYTPCLDEKYQEARREHDRSGTTPELLQATSPKDGIDGMDTELISEEDENTFKEDEAAAASTSKATSSGVRKKDTTFKKVNKKGKERNYRGDKDNKKKDRNEDKENDSRRSRERDRDRDRNRSRRPRRKELPRYDVRTVIAEKRPKVVKDPFGRDVTPKPVSKTRSRSRSRSPAERRREMSISLSPEPPRRYNRRRSQSPRFRARNRTPPTFYRRSRTPEAVGAGRPLRMRSISRSRSPIVHRHRPSRSVSRSPSPLPGRHGRVPVMAPKSRSRSVSLQMRGKAKKLKKKKSRQAASLSRSRSPSEGRGGKKKSKKSRKKKNKHRGVSPSAGSGQKKKKSRRRSTSPMLSPSQSRSGSPIPGQTTGVLTERFAKVRQQNSWTPPPPTRPKSNGTNLTVILTNEEALAKQAKERERKRKEARRRDRARDKNLPSKEVFTSGDNILVSVSFNDKNLNKENQQAAGGEGEVSAAVAQKRMKDIAKKRAEADKAKRKRLERLKKTRGEAPKPVVIIDLDRSPFRVITPSPRAVIVLSDSDAEKEKERREGAAGVANGGQSAAEVNTSGGQSASQRKSPAERHEEDIFGPKTPPGFPSQPQPSQSKPAAPKFTMQVKSKSTNLRPLNPLYEPGELDEGKTPERMDNAESSNYSMVGPNTPPEPAPQSPSPDVYDPFEPTKSPSPSPSRRDNASIERLSDLDDAVLPSSSGKVDGPDSGAGGDPKADSQNADESMNGDQEPATRGSKITILSNIVISQPSNSGQGLVSGSGVSASQQNNTGDDSDVIFDDFVSSSAPAPSNNVGYSTSSSANPIKSYSTAANSSSLISKLPLPPGAAGGQKFSDFINPTDSPYSPGASDFDDLFEPGGELDSPPPAPTKQSYKPTKIPTKGAKKAGGGNFDNLFGSSPANNFGKRSGKKGGHKRRGKPKGDDEEDLSKLSTKEKFMRKLNRLERVVEEVKLVIKPFYNKKQINKEEYKDILRRAVPKICHSRTGEINPIKIQKLIKAYVHKVRARRRLAKKGGAGGGGAGGGPVGLPGVNVNPLII